MKPMLLVLVLFGASLVSAQDYPVKQVRVVLPFAPGGGTDILARLWSQRMLEWTGQTFTVDNRPGAGGNIGAEIVARAPADGYTLLFTSASITVNVSLYPKLAYDLTRDFIPIAQMASAPLLLVVHPSVPAKSVRELIALSKRQKGGLNFGSNGNGTTSHLSGLLMNQTAGMQLTHIAYKGAGAAINGILTGEVDKGFVAAFSGVPHVKGGRLRALAVTTRQRSPALPEVATLDSMYPGFETDNWFALFAVTGTPQPIVQRLHAMLVKSLQHPDVKGYIEREGGYAIGNSMADFVQVIARDIDKYGKLVRASGAKADQ